MRKARFPCASMLTPIQTAGHAAFEIIFGRKESSVRAAITHRHAKTLCAANGYIGARVHQEVLTKYVREDQLP